MNLTKIAIDNNRVTLMILVVIFAMGLGAYNQLSRDSMPPFTIRVCSVITEFRGASPERVEALITDKIEKKSKTRRSKTFVSLIYLSNRHERK